MSKTYPPHQPQADELNDDIGLAPADALDPVVEAYKKDVDRTLIRENLKLSPDQWARKFLDFAKFAWELRASGRRARERDPNWGLK